MINSVGIRVDIVRYIVTANVEVPYIGITYVVIESRIGKYIVVQTYTS